MRAGASASTRAWLLLILAICMEVTATLSLKGALQHPALYVVVALGYLGAFISLALVLRGGMPLGVAYGIWGASGVALTAILSMLLFGEPLTAPMAIGIVLVIAGVLCVETGAPAPAVPDPEPRSGVGPASTDAPGPGADARAGAAAGHSAGPTSTTSRDEVR